MSKNKKIKEDGDRGRGKKEQGKAGDGLLSLLNEM